MASKLKSVCSSTNDDHSASDLNGLVVEALNSLVNPTFIQNLKSSINLSHSRDDKVKGHEISQCMKKLAALYFNQEARDSFFDNTCGDFLAKDSGFSYDLWKRFKE